MLIGIAGAAAGCASTPTTPDAPTHASTGVGDASITPAPRQPSPILFAIALERVGRSVPTEACVGMVCTQLLLLESGEFVRRSGDGFVSGRLDAETLTRVRTEVRSAFDTLGDSHGSAGFDVSHYAFLLPDGEGDRYATSVASETPPESVGSADADARPGRRWDPLRTFTDALAKALAPVREAPVAPLDEARRAAVCEVGVRVFDTVVGQPSQERR